MSCRILTVRLHFHLQGRGNKSDVDQRCSQLKDQIEETNSEYEREKLQERLARLASGVGVLKVGGSSEVRPGS